MSFSSYYSNSLLLCYSLVSFIKGSNLIFLQTNSFLNKLFWHALDWLNGLNVTFTYRLLADGLLHAVWSAIGMIPSSVCRLSVCLWRSVLWRSGSV